MNEKFHGHINDGKITSQFRILHMKSIKRDTVKVRIKS